MLDIVKKAEPAELRAYREKTPEAGYAGASKRPMRAALHDEQGGLCAYCMRRIHDHPSAGSRQIDFSIEHWSAQSTAEERSLHWPDLFAVCDGTLDQSQICDKARGTSRSPSTPRARPVRTKAAAATCPTGP